MADNTQQLTPQIPLSQQADSVVPIPPSSIQKKHFFIIGGVILLILFFLLIIFLMRHKESYQFTIDTEIVPKESVQSAYSYLIKQPNATRQQALGSIVSVYKQHHILESEYKKYNLSQADFIKRTTEITSKQNNDIPGPLQKIIIENSAMQQLLTKKLGIKKRSGDAWLTFVNAPSPDQFGSTSAFLKQRLSFYKSQIDTGADYAKVKAVFLRDEQINNFTTYKPKILSFVDMTPNHPFMPGSDFIDKTFATQPNNTSEIFQTVYNGILMNGFSYITAGQDGNISNFPNWLTEKEAALHVVTDFSGIK